jgi:4,5-dihydroxyphthalate decarboxylase
MSKLELTLAVSHYDHVIDIVLGRVQVEGIELICMQLPLHDIFQRTVGYADFDIAEMSLAIYVSMRSQGDDRLIALPVFLSRVSRHSAIYVRKDHIKSVADFAGKRIGVPEWAQTAAVYGRGVMAHELGIDLTSIKWVQAGLGEAARAEKVPLKLPKGLDLTPIADRSLTEMLDKGDLDGVIAAVPPECFYTNANVGRFYDNWLEAELEYARKKRIFPIMHALVVKKSVLDKAPWVAGNLFHAFDTARKNSMKRCGHLGATVVPVPWLADAVARAREAMGGDFWPYGLEANRPTLEAFLQFAFEQGVCHRLLKPEEIFPPQTHHAVRV